MARRSKSKAIARRGLMLVLSSPSGAGKTTLSRMLLTVERGLELSISVTTRPKRRGEVNGRHYHFIDRKRFVGQMGGNFEVHRCEQHFGCHEAIANIRYTLCLAQKRHVSSPFS